MRRPARVVTAALIAFAANAGWSRPSTAWGNEGHEVVALIAQSHLDPAVRDTVKAMLAADTDTLTAHSIDAEATWADKYRDTDRDGARQATRLWHFVDLELDAPDLNRACFGHPPTPPGTPAFNGPAQDCVVDKIEAFAAELANPATSPTERIVALKFVLHLVGDLHQPLHAADNHDRGGNEVRVAAPGVRAGTLHHYWDTEFVLELGPDTKRIAAALNGRISAAEVTTWSHGRPSDWALESFGIAKDHVYGRLPPSNARGSHRLTEEYVAMATRDVASQLSKAGVRLAGILNGALGQRNGRR